MNTVHGESADTHTAAPDVPLKLLPKELERIKAEVHTRGASMPSIVVVCRRGNDSQEAVVLLRANGLADAVSMRGGLLQWSQDVDAHFPVY